MLHLDIQEEIMKRVPVKSLIRFRSVSKTWKSLINSSSFIAGYSGLVQHLLVAYASIVDDLEHLHVDYEDESIVENKYVSIVDDCIPSLKKDFLTVPLLVHMLKHSTIIGCSHGLLCLYGLFVSQLETYVIWNISIRKAVAVVEHDEPLVGGIYRTVTGFGVCREVNDPKIVKITYVKRGRDVESLSAIPWQVAVFTLSTGAWRSSHNNPSHKSIRLSGSHVAVNGVLYWLATDMVTIDGEFRSYNLIVSFDMTSEEFREVHLPDSLAHKARYHLSLSEERGSLVVLEYNVETNNVIVNVGMMEDGVPNSFTKLFSIDAKIPLASVLGFNKSGEPIIEMIKDDHHRQLVVYEPYSKHIDNLGFNEVKFSFSVYPYMETLLLLDQRDLLIYTNGKRCILKRRKRKNLEEFKQCINQ